MTKGGLRRSAIELDERALEIERVDQVLAKGSLAVTVTLDWFPILPAALSLEFENVAFEASGPYVPGESAWKCETPDSRLIGRKSLSNPSSLNGLPSSVRREAALTCERLAGASSGQAL